MVISFNAVQLLKAQYCNSVKLFDSTTSLKLMQPLKAYLPISVTLSGIVISVKSVQSLNKQSTIFVMPSSKVTLVKPLFANMPVLEFSSLFTKDFGISISFNA